MPGVQPCLANIIPKTKQGFVLQTFSRAKLLHSGETTGQKTHPHSSSTYLSPYILSKYTMFPYLLPTYQRDKCEPLYKFKYFKRVGVYISALVIGTWTSVSGSTAGANPATLLVSIFL